MKRNRKLAFLGILCLVLMGVFLFGCGDSSSNIIPKTNYLVVADAYNARVLMYTTPLSTNQSATTVLGQADFITTTVGTTASTTGRPAAVVTDDDGNLWVGDVESNCRVLQFKPPFTNGKAASVVIGKPDFASSGCATATASAIGAPINLAFDSSGNLWVSDYTNTRVLEFKPPFSSGMTATIVLGQPDFTSKTGGTSASQMNYPRGLKFDSSGNLWVADSSNNRVLRFSPPFSNGMAATLELGQPSATAFTTVGANQGGISASSMYEPSGLAFDKDGNLWVVENSNHRALQFKPPFSNGMAATLVIGQPDFTSSSGAATSSVFAQSTGITVDSSGNVIVADPGAHRVLVFSPPFSNGMAATTVLGQTGFTAVTANQGGSAGANTLNLPWGVTVAH